MSHLQKNQKYVTASQSVITQIAPNEQEDAHLAKGLEPAAVVPTQPEWNCSTCTFTNVANRTSCEMCNTNCSGVGALFTKLLQLQDSCSIMPSSSPIECPICLGDVPSDNAVVLASCLHSFCRECLTQSVQRNQRADVICPYMDATFSCAAALLDKEIRALLDEADYTAHLQRSVNEVEVMATDSFHCRTPNCNFWLLVDGYRKANNEAYDPKKDAPLVVNCPVCKSSNCLRCDENHDGLSCEELAQRKIDERENNMVADILKRRIVARCPSCKILVQKNGGCNHMICKCGWHFNYDISYYQ